MKGYTRNTLFTALGLAIGTVGIKALTSNTAKRGYVHAMAQGMKVRSDYEVMIEQAKAEFDDMKAQAEYLVANEKAVDEAE